jgi:hypothetical protein
MNKLEELLEENPDAQYLKADGFDDAVLGTCYWSERLIYSRKKIHEILMKEGMEGIEAIEHFEFNIGGAYVGEKTPIYLNDL